MAGASRWRSDMTWIEVGEIVSFVDGAKEKA